MSGPGRYVLPDWAERRSQDSGLRPLPCGVADERSAGTERMSPYERRRWAELEEHWTKTGERRQIVPAKVRQALTSAAGSRTGAAGPLPTSGRD